MDMPNVFLSGGGGKSPPSAFSSSSDFGVDWEMSAGDRGLLVGIPEMGDGGTKGKDSKIESSPAEAAERADPLESL